jgi:hypothetical protein
MVKLNPDRVKIGNKTICGQEKQPLHSSGLQQATPFCKITKYVPPDANSVTHWASLNGPRTLNFVDSLPQSTEAGQKRSHIARKKNG